MFDWKNSRVYIKPGITDMRKGINGLALIVQEEMKETPFSGSLFLFCNRQRDKLKILYWDKNGFCLWLKRLEKHRFPWPKTADDKQELSHRQLKMLLEGIDFFNKHTTLTFSSLN
jgi:transposase